MKKLALALVCLVSVAFFASCEKPVENPEPSIAVVTGDNYVYDGQTIDLYQEYQIGFRAASNSQTQKELSSFRMEVKVYDGSEVRNLVYEFDTTFAISGTEYVFEDVVYFEMDRDIVGVAEYTATVTDIDGKLNSTTLTVNLNLAEEPLAVTDFEWFRHGSNNQHGLEEYGLVWEQNAKETHAQIKPIPNSGVILYKFEDSSVWDRVIFPSQKEAVFSDGAVTASVYNNVSTSQNGQYDDVIGTRMPDGTFHLIRVEMCRIGTYTAQGYPITIYGKSK